MLRVMAFLWAFLHLEFQYYKINYRKGLRVEDVDVKNIFVSHYHADVERMAFEK